MLDEIRTFTSQRAFEGFPVFRLGVTSRLVGLPAFKADADFVFSQVSFSLDALLRWRDQLVFNGPVYAGVMVLASVLMANKLAGRSRDRHPRHCIERDATLASNSPASSLRTSAAAACSTERTSSPSAAHPCLAARLEPHQTWTTP